MTRRHAPGKGERGQALIELALVAPIMIVILAALVQFGIIFERQIGIENAVREAARRGATLTTKDVTGAQINANWTLTQLQSILANTQTHDTALDRDLEVCFYNPPLPNSMDASGTRHQSWVTVSAGYAHPLFLPIVDLIIDGIDGSNDRRLRVDTSATFTVEQPTSDTSDYNIGTGAAARVNGDTTPC